MHTIIRLAEWGKTSLNGMIHSNMGCDNYLTHGCENQSILSVVRNAVDNMGLNLHI